MWNVVTADEIKDIQEEIRQCLSYDGMQRFKPTMHTIPFEEMSLAPFMKEEELYRFSCTNITIAIAGCDRRVGVTTTAFNLVCWINAHGGTACYLEANTSNHLAHIVHMFKPEKIGNAYAMEGNDFYLTRELNQGYNFIVVDCGVLREQHLQKTFVDAEIRLLCGSAMPYELAGFYRAMERCKGLPIHALGLFVPDNMRPYLIETISQNILFVEGSHDLFDSNANGEVFRTILKVHIVI
ncbi:hypothetical protein PDUR_19350 [Paenibacillus durus]|uniref:Uncharacterized protein n=1 Tax=Paenibacillus durus TaxID=44251 RepID=A0A089IY01_PAEDU|nr:hypothetical protein PDUR_19350 [Paenibacillus durus]